MALLLTCLLGALPLHAHEFWIAPETYVVQPNTPIRAHLRVGEGFEGATQSYFPRQFARFDVTLGDETRAVEGRIGDIPALDMVLSGEGLAVIAHETRGHSLRYRERALFERFVSHKELNGTLERHAARGLPELEFREAYTRYAKSLVAIGAGKGEDRALGLHHEFVALTNPYHIGADGAFAAQLLYEGAPRAGALVEVFMRAPNGDVTVTQHRTDEAGIVHLTLVPAFEYLLDAVVMEDTGNDDPGAGPVWHSAWAALTFAAGE